MACYSSSGIAAGAWPSRSPPAVATSTWCPSGRSRTARQEACVHRDLHSGAAHAGSARPLDRDARERRFVEHTLQIAIQAMRDVASHIVSDERLGEPRTNQELLELLT